MMRWWPERRSGRRDVAKLAFPSRRPAVPTGRRGSLLARRPAPAGRRAGTPPPVLASAYSQRVKPATRSGA